MGKGLRLLLARPAEKREAICGKGDILFELAASDSQNYQRAIESYDRLVADRVGALGVIGPAPVDDRLISAHSDSDGCPAGEGVSKVAR